MLMRPAYCGLDTLRRMATHESLTASWLAVRTGLEPRLIEAMRRDGELIGVRPPGSWEHHYPLWQFDEEWRPLPEVKRITQAARDRGLDERRLYEVLNARLGLGGERRLGSSLRTGNVERVLAAIRSA
jgi:hypothetical protein